MKTRLATLLSIGGVLVAGSAAALVNTQVLQTSANNNSGAVSAVTESLVTPNSLPADGALTVETNVPPDTVASVAPPVSVATVVPATTGTPIQTQGLYQIGDAGLVTIDTAGDVLTIVSAAPNAGWALVKAENEGPLNIKVSLQSGTTLVDFRADLLFGVVTTSVESKDMAAPAGGGAPRYGDDHDDEASEGGGDDD